MRGARVACPHESRALLSIIVGSKPITVRGPIRKPLRVDWQRASRPPWPSALDMRRYVSASSWTAWRDTAAPRPPARKAGASGTTSGCRQPTAKAAAAIATAVHAPRGPYSMWPPAALAGKPQDGLAPADGGDTARGGVRVAMQPSARPGVHDPAVNPFDAIAARMESFAAAMSEGDGVRIFNGLYLAVTRAVGADFANHRFEDPAFFARLASVFAQLYFDAVECDAAERPGRASGRRCSRSACRRESRRCSSRWRG